MLRIARAALVAAAVVFVAAAGAQDWRKMLEKAVPGAASGSGSSTASSLTQGEIAGGLREALSQGVQRAIDALGRRDGFLGNPEVRIPMPDTLSKVESALRAVGQGRYADQFVETMNRAAEQAVPEAADIFGSALSRMTMDDARSILDGPDDAATQYFQRTSTGDLVERFRPIVASATDQVGVTASYKKLVDNSGFVGQMLGSDATDVDGYVTEKAVDGLFELIAQEEKRIRENPVARTTDLLKKVFQ
jgi:hypothetical protein